MKGAEVMRGEIFRFRGWCDACQDGVNGGRVYAEAWVRAHNNKRHPNEDKS